MHGLYFKIRLWVMEISFLEFERRFKMEMNRNMCILKWIHSISWCSFWLLSFCFFQIFSKISVFQSTVCVSVCVWIIQSSMTLCHPMDYSPPGSSAMGFSRQEYWSGLPFPIPGDLPDPGIEPSPPTLQADSLLSEPPGIRCELRKKICFCLSRALVFTWKEETLVMSEDVIFLSHLEKGFLASHGYRKGCC